MMKERKVWNRLYRHGKKSRRKGVFNKNLGWVWDVINKYAENDIKESCIDVGCGDLTFWSEHVLFMRKCKNYIGIDVSDVIIYKNRKKYKNRKFYCLPASKYIKIRKSNVVLCIDVLFHIFDDKEYVSTLNNLCRYSSKYIFITTWYKDSFYDKFVHKYRDFDEYQYIFYNHGFELIDSIKIPFNNIGMFYVYKRVD